MEELNFLLMGKTGNGKSATGNSLLKREHCFKSSCDMTSKTKDVESHFSKFDNHTLMVVDGPGLEDTDMNNAEDKKSAVKNMGEALAKCYGGVDAFLLVIKFGNKFTAEDKSTLDALKSIFGPSFLDYVIVVISGGDYYRIETEEEDCTKSFPLWCRKQEGTVGQLYKDCKERFVLFNNKEKDEVKKRSQIQKIIQLTKELGNKQGRYTSQCFLDAEKEREKLVVKCNKPILELKIQKTVSLLNAAIQDFSKQPSETEKVKIRARITDVKKEIKVEDKGFGLLDDLQTLVKKVEENLDDAMKLQVLAQQLEDVRKAKETWTVLGSVCAVAGGIICLAAAPVGAVIAASTAAVIGGGAGFAGVSALTAGIRHDVLGSREKGIAKQKKQLENKIENITK